MRTRTFAKVLTCIFVLFSVLFFYGMISIEVFWQQLFCFASFLFNLYLATSVWEDSRYG